MEHPAYTMAAACILGGVAGYVRKRSVPSLFGGLTVGIMYGAGAYLMHQNQDYGVHLALSASILLTAASAPRALKLRAPVPLFLTALGLLTTSYYGKKYYDFYV
ncbi:hypothetical protein BZA70DRAFT_154129 [Myxozyma melibiosi]|uniref:Transmembrane protein 14 n=1 Tax=Myxozyma melibiosi TaxID=54550 RepID=A0ABR1F8B0_9ASCO